MTVRSAALLAALAAGSAPAVAQDADYRPGSAFADGPDLPEMVVVPPGDFIMGSSQEERDALGVVPLFDSMESPRHKVAIGYRFAISRYEVTFAQWDACVADGGCNGYRPADEGWGRGRRPVINVHYGNAVSYVEWLRRKTGQRYRLPSEAEWEYAARAGTSSWFPFGNSADPAKANFGNNVGRTLPVGSYPPNAFGLHDMIGNVAEWTADCHHDGFAGAPADGSAWDAHLACPERNVRGSGWSLSGWTTRAAQRINDPIAQRNNHLGLRVVRDLPQPRPR